MESNQDWVRIFCFHWHQPACFCVLYYSKNQKAEKSINKIVQQKTGETLPIWQVLFLANGLPDWQP